MTSPVPTSDVSSTTPTTDPLANPSITPQGAAQAGAGGAGGDQSGAGPFMLKASATFAVFLVLGLIAATGPNAAKFSAGVGGLMTLGIVLNAASSFSGMVSAISSAKAPAKTPVTAPAPAPNAYSPPEWAGLLSQNTTPAGLPNAVNSNTTPAGQITTPGQGIGPLDVGDPNQGAPAGGKVGGGIPDLFGDSTS